MGLLNGALKLVGSAALVVTGTASALVRTAANAADNYELESLMGKAQDASFNKIKDMWTSEDKKDDAYYNKKDQDSLKREYNSKISAASQLRNMADAARKGGDSEKYEELMEKSRELWKEAKDIEVEIERMKEEI